MPELGSSVIIGLVGRSQFATKYMQGRDPMSNYAAGIVNSRTSVDSVGGLSQGTLQDDWVRRCCESSTECIKRGEGLLGAEHTQGRQMHPPVTKTRGVVAALT